LNTAATVRARLRLRNYVPGNRIDATLRYG